MTVLAPDIVGLGGTQDTSAVVPVAGATAITTSQVGDGCVIMCSGVQVDANNVAFPVYNASDGVGGAPGANADAGFSGHPDHTAIGSVGGASGKCSMWYKALTADDFTSLGTLRQFKIATSHWTGPKIHIAVFRDHLGVPFNQASMLYSHYFDTGGFTANTDQTYTTNCPKPCIGILQWASSSAASTLAFKWGGGTARDPYWDDGPGLCKAGGHGSRTDSTGVTINSGSLTHTDPSMTAADVGSVLSGTGFTANQLVTSVNVGAGTFTSSANANAGASSVTVTPHYGSTATTKQADYELFADTDTPGTFQINVGAATHGMLGAVFQVSDPPIFGTQAVEHDHPQAGTVLLTTVGTQAVEHDHPVHGTVPGGPIAGNQAAEHDTPQAGVVSQGYTIIGNQAHEIDTARPGGFFIGTWTERVDGPQSEHFRLTTLTMRVFKKNLGDVGDVRFSLLQGSTPIAGPTSWTALTDTPTDVVLDVSAASVSDPSNLWIQYSFRRLQNDNLEPAISWIALDWESWAVEADHPQAGKVLLTVVGRQATERDHPVAGILPLIIVGNQAHEIDHPQAPAIRGAQAVEIDHPQAGVVLVNLPRKSEKRVFPPKSRFEVVQWM